MTAKGIYIYGIVPNLINSEKTNDLLDKTGIYTISYLNSSAIVSDMESEFINHSDKESLGHLLVHHQKTIENLNGNGN